MERPARPLDNVRLGSGVVLSETVTAGNLASVLASKVFALPTVTTVAAGRAFASGASDMFRARFRVYTDRLVLVRVVLGSGQAGARVGGLTRTLRAFTLRFCEAKK